MICLISHLLKMTKTDFNRKIRTFVFFSKFFFAKIPPILGKTKIYVVIWFGGGSVDRTLRFPGSAEPHRTSKFGRTDPDPERFGRSLEERHFIKQKKKMSKISLFFGKTRIYVVIWFGGGSVDRTWRFGGSAEPHRTSKFGRTEPEPEWFGRSLI